MPVLEVRELSSGYGEVQIVWEASLDLEEGRLTSLVGANGAGKTTLLRTVVGQLRPRSGSVRFAGSDVTWLPAHLKAEQGLILVPEGRQLFAAMSVRENLELGATPRRARARMKQNLRRVFELFPALEPRQAQTAGTLSGGEQQMLAVARGIMSEPLVLMVDELSLGLSPRLTLELFRALRRLRGEGLTILLVEQNVRMALEVSDYAYVLGNGRIELHGSAREVRQDDGVRRAYMGV